MNAIFSLEDIRNSLTEEQKTCFFLRYRFNADLPEGRHTNGTSRILYQANIASLEGLEEIKGVLEGLDSPVMIGLWINKGKNCGLQQGYKYQNNGTAEEPIMTVVRNTTIDVDGNETDEVIAYPFNFQEYKKYLKDVPDTKDEEGNTLTWRRPTDKEARNTHVNSFGDITRDLNTYNF